MKLERPLGNYDTQLNDLFKEYNPNPTLLKQIKEVQDYYDLSYEKAKSKKTMKAIADSYGTFIDKLALVQQGDLSREEMINTINEANYSRKISILIHNLIKACELIFWIAASVSLYASIFAIALPVLVVQPPLGIAITVAIGGLILKAAASCIQSLTEFRGFGRHDTEYSHEVSLVSFFPLKGTKEQVTAVASEESICIPA